jgi:glycerate 2-kinase
MTNDKLKILLAPNNFKESLTASEAAAAMAAGVAAVWPDAICTMLPLADGGSGTVEAFLQFAGGKPVTLKVADPLGRPVNATYALIDQGQTAVIELAAASGLARLTAAERQPLLASTYGSGQLIRDALARGCQQIILGLGDSATVDGGLGALQALGLQVRDANQQLLPSQAQSLRQITQIDTSQLDHRLAQVKILILSDVNNPLLGAQGAAQVFAPQKGATPDMVLELEAGLANWAQQLMVASGRQVATFAGSGAAGGVAAGLGALSSSTTVSGSEFICQQAQVATHLAKSHLVFTGEGRIDAQSLQGKLLAHLANLAQLQSVPLVAFAGKIALPPEQWQAAGFAALVPIVDAVMSLADAQQQAAHLLAAAVSRTLTLIQLGQQWSVIERS